MQHQELDAQKQTTDVKIEELEAENAVLRQEFQELKAMILFTQVASKQLITQTEGVVAITAGGSGGVEDFKQAMEIFVGARFDNELLEKTRQEVEQALRIKVGKVLDEIIAAKQPSLKNAQCTQQASLTAAEQGN